MQASSVEAHGSPSGPLALWSRREEIPALSKILRTEIIAADEADGPEFKVAGILHGEPNFQCSNDGLLVNR
jgi:hypothetical protein